MLETERSDKIELLTLAEVTSVEGYVGNFEVEILQHARYTKQDCNGCGACFDVCPVVVPNEFDCGLGTRRAIYSSFAQSVPMVAQIDMDACILCGNCANICELTAVDYEQQDVTFKVKVGGIIVATGWDEYIPETGYLGFNQFENVITELSLERMLAPNGPTVGNLHRPSDGQHPESVLFVQCVGSRDVNRNVYCSSGVCCMISIKNSQLIKSHNPDIDVTVAYIDIRAAGKGYEEYYTASRRAGVKYIRSKVGRIREDTKTKSLKIVLEDTLSPDKTIKEYTFDLVVLATSMMPSRTFGKLNKVLNLSKHPSGFIKEFHQRLNTVDTDIPGISLSGACHGPKAISESIMQAKGAASSIEKLLANGEYRISLIRAIPNPDTCARCGMCRDVCPYEAIQITQEQGAIVDDILCRGCGLCAAVCPSESITIRYYREAQFQQQIDAMLEEILQEGS
ncbi:MAG: 4Fe-4S binding protein [Promethearchaeota archaeon]